MKPENESIFVNAVEIDEISFVIEPADREAIYLIYRFRVVHCDGVVSALFECFDAPARYIERDHCEYRGAL